MFRILYVLCIVFDERYLIYNIHTKYHNKNNLNNQLRRITLMKNDITANEYQGMSINNQHGGCDVNILNRLFDINKYVSDKRKRICFTVLTFTFPADNYYPDQNNLFVGFLDSFITHLRRKGLDPQYLWARELKDDNYHSHYHLALWTDGYKDRCIYDSYLLARTLWCKRLLIPESDGYVHYNKSTPQLHLDSNNPDYTEKYQEMVYWGSYLCKCEQKGNLTEHHRNWSSSRLC